MSFKSTALMSQTSTIQTRTVSKAGHSERDGASDGLTSLVIDNDPHLLEQSYHLRYQVYCLERGFLPAAKYPDGREVDDFDAHSIHLGVLNTEGKLVGTVRLVEPSDAGLPMFHHCTLFEDSPSLHETSVRVVETSRLAISRQYNRGRSDGFYDLEGLSGLMDIPERRKGDIFLHLYKGGYQASKRRGFTHWLAATEKSLQRLMIRYGFPWKAIGAEVDYYGRVSPYLMDLREFDDVILSRRIAVLRTFLDGLEPEFMPVAAEAAGAD
jgi:N-acyl amino acid synthase of PEP-CTERM/exosortase system